MIVELRISQIETPQGYLPRVITGTISEKVKEYAEMIENGVVFDPIKVWQRPDGRIWLIDGAHRLEAHKMVGQDYIKAELINCSDEVDYRVKAIEANLKHGIPLMKEEKVLLAQALYKAGVKTPALQKLFGVSDRTIQRWVNVKEVKSELVEKAKQMREEGKTQEEIARELGVSRQTLYNWENEECKKTDKMSEILHPTQPAEEEDDFQWLWDAVDEEQKKQQEEEQKQQQEDDDIKIVKLQWQPPKKEKEVKFEDPDEIWKELREEIEEKLSILIDKFGPNDVQELLEDLKIDIALGKYKRWPGYLTMLGLKRIRGREW